jgi:hypothetical protein
MVEMVLITIPVPRVVIDKRTACVSAIGARRLRSSEGHQSVFMSGSRLNGR